MIVKAIVMAMVLIATAEATGRFTWTPGPEHLGKHTITIYACDSRGGEDTETIVITVYPNRDSRGKNIDAFCTMWLEPNGFTLNDFARARKYWQK